MNYSTNSTAVVIYCCVTNHLKTEWFPSAIMNSLANESAIWDRLGRESSSLLHTALAGVAQQQTEGSMFKIALSCDWQVGTGCWLKVQVGLGTTAFIPLHLDLCMLSGFVHSRIAGLQEQTFPEREPGRSTVTSFDLLVYGRNTTWITFVPCY